MLANVTRAAPDAVYMPVFYASLLMQNEEWEAAVQASEQAEQNALNAEAEHPLLTPEFYFRTGAACERAGRFEKAEHYFSKALKLDPNHAATCNYVAYMRAEQGVRLEAALELVNRALEADPDHGAYLDTRGWIYYQQGRYEAAMEELLKAIEQVPNDPTVLDHLGDCALKLNRPEDARLFWQQSLEQKDCPEIAEKIKSLNLNPASPNDDSAHPPRD
jgi:tetratricopeptide (TPR) repeat protein